MLTRPRQITFIYKAVLVLGLVLYSSVGSAAQCQTVIYFGNGIMTSKDSAIQNAVLLGVHVNAVLKKKNESIPDNCLNYAYAASGLLAGDDVHWWDGVFDIFESYGQIVTDAFAGIVQGVFSRAPSPEYLTNSDLQAQVAKYREALDTSDRIVIVSHSQGNLFANEAYKVLTTGSDGRSPIREDRVKVVSVATPGLFVAGKGEYTTLDGDIILLVATARPPNTDRSGTHCPLLPGPFAASLSCHDFVNSYLVGTASEPSIMRNVLAALTATTGQPTWTQKAPFPANVGTRGTTSFSIGNTGYVIVPWDGNNAASQLWEYNPLLNAWTQLRNHPNLLPESPSFVLNGKAYVVSGTQVWQYTPAADLWIQKAPVPGTDKRGGFGFAVTGRGYIGGGFYNGGALWEYNDANDQWTRKNDHPLLTYVPNNPATVLSVDAVTFTISNKTYLTGTNSLFWEYAPATDTWTEKSCGYACGAYVEAVYGLAFSIGSDGYVVNARGGMYRYNVTNNQWTTLGIFPGQTVYSPAGFAIGGSLYVGIGERFPNTGGSFDIVKDWWEFRP